MHGQGFILGDRCRRSATENLTAQLKPLYKTDDVWDIDGQ
jgi:hypothetical protein